MLEDFLDNSKVFALDELDDLGSRDAIGLLVVGQLLDALEPGSKFGILGGIHWQEHHKAGKGGSDVEIGNGQVVSSQIIATFQEQIQGLVHTFQGIDFGLWNLRLVLPEERERNSCSGGRDHTGVVVQTLIDNGSLLQILGVQRIILAILAHQVGVDGMAVGQVETIVIYGGHRMQGVNLKELWL